MTPANSRKRPELFLCDKCVAELFPDETPPAEQKSERSGQLSLTHILDEYEARANAATPPTTVPIVCKSQRDVLKLVKALRRAVEFLDWELARDPQLKDHRKKELAQLLSETAEEKKQNISGIKEPDVNADDASKAATKPNR